LSLSKDLSFSASWRDDKVRPGYGITILLAEFCGFLPHTTH
jgi:hypothetical protein